tara:strand:+ start:899 stop:1075 length:177 start_codon:yes stop_codon:yes gene_type:complete
MAYFRIYEQCIVEVIYEVEADSKTQAKQMYDSGLAHEYFVGETDLEATGKVEVEEWPA